jgi:hypothetical protein
MRLTPFERAVLTAPHSARAGRTPGTGLQRSAADAREQKLRSCQGFSIINAGVVQPPAPVIFTWAPSNGAGTPRHTPLASFGCGLARCWNDIT